MFHKYTYKFSYIRIHIHIYHYIASLEYIIKVHNEYMFSYIPYEWYSRQDSALDSPTHEYQCI